MIPVSISPEVKIFNKRTYLNIKIKNGDEPYYATQTVHINTPNLVKKLIFPINNIEEPHLFNFVTGLEKSVDHALRNLKNPDLEKQVPKLMLQLKNKCVDKDSIILRPNYSETNPVYTCFFKGNPNAISMYTWEGKPIDDPKELGAGEYQFIVRANLLYFGPHTSCNAIANLQVRISSLRYRPIELKKEVPLQWDFNTDKSAVLKRAISDVASSSKSTNKRIQPKKAKISMSTTAVPSPSPAPSTITTAKKQIDIFAEKSDGDDEDMCDCGDCGF